MKRVFFAVAALMLAALSDAQQSVKLAFSGSGEREVWIADAPPESAPKNTIRTQGGSYELQAPNPGAHDSVFVWDKRTGNLAFKALKAAAGAWNVQDSDYRYVTKVDVRIEHKGLPVESASIRFRDGRQDVSRVLDSTGSGVVSFWGVKAGPVKVEVAYNSKGETKGPLVQTFDVSMKRSSPVPILVVGIAEPVATVPERSGQASNPVSGESDSAPNSGGVAGGQGSERGSGRSDVTNPVGGLISFLLSVAVAALFVWFGLRWMKQNQDRVQSKLESMGVAIPNPAEDGSATVVAPIAPQPVEKIILDGAEPSIPTGAGATVVSEPRLIAPNRSIEIPEGESLVSRDQGEIVIADESTVSRRHAMLTRSGASVTIVDLGSTNGTFVNGAKVDSAELRPGDTVQFGAVAFKFEG